MLIHVWDFWYERDYGRGIGRLIWLVGLMPKSAGFYISFSIRIFQMLGFDVEKWIEPFTKPVPYEAVS